MSTRYGLPASLPDAEAVLIHKAFSYAASESLAIIVAGVEVEDAGILANRHFCSQPRRATTGITSELSLAVMNGVGWGENTLRLDSAPAASD
jgi:hypothetical protein